MTEKHTENPHTITTLLQAIGQEADHLQTQSGSGETPFRLIAVSKGQPDAKREEALAAGHRVFGENYWQEGHAHWAEQRNHYKELELHFLGPLQSNKARDVAGFFDVIHSVDRPKLAKALADAMLATGTPRDCFIQVNTGEEPQKGGVLPADAPALLDYCIKELHLPIVGLMCIPPAEANPAAHFAFLRQMAADYGLPRLSMGMSADWQTALRLGATDIRLGTAIFGERQTQK